MRLFVLLSVVAVAITPAVERMSATPQGGATALRRPGFRDVARAVGVDFTHINGASQDMFFPEIMGSGGLFFDYDNDGRLDIFLVDGGSIADPALEKRARHRLYHQRDDGRFEDVTAASGIQHRGYGMGACAGDIDNDGLVDLYITNVNGNQLYRNAGRGTFTEVANAGGTRGNLWSTSCAFVDIDRDGDLDLFVTNYVDARENHVCGVAGPPPVRDYCHPLIYPPLVNTLYRNDGRGRFEDISKSSGIAGHVGNGLGVAVADVDEDGWPDVFVANDSTPNFLFHNEGNGTFTEIGERAGVAITIDGKAKAGMGTAFGDFTGSGRPGLIVTNHEKEMHSLFANLGARVFSDVTIRSGVGPATRPFVGFGVAFLDYDNDTRLDIAIANGNVMANAGQLRTRAKYGQRNLLLRNLGERFVRVDTDAGSGFDAELVSRALAAGDIDNDGDVDLLITNNGAAPTLLLNEASTGHALLVRVIGTRSNRSGIGARIIATIGQHRQEREVQSGSSYLGQNDLRAQFGLGDADHVDRLEVKWPSGITDVAEKIPAKQMITIREGQGVVSHEPLR